MSEITLQADMPIQLNSRMDLEKRRGKRQVIVSSIPLAMFVDAHERQCQSNHSQTLERIRERGGFGAAEAVAVLSCLNWTEVETVRSEAAHYILYSLIATFNRGQRVAEKRLALEVS